MRPAAQLLLQQSGVVTWYRRTQGELWQLTPDDERGFVATMAPSAAGAWLCADATGAPALHELPPQRSPVAAVLVHPRTQDRLLAGPEGLVVVPAPSRPGGAVEPEMHNGPTGPTGSTGSTAPTSRVLLSGAVQALAWSSDLRRIYAATSEGTVWMVPSTARGPDASEPVVLAELPRLGDDARGLSVSLAMGPGGLLAVTPAAVYGINLRHGTCVRLFALPALVPASGWMEAPAVAVDHQRFIYLADDREVTRCRGDGSEPARCGAAPTSGDRSPTLPGAAR